MQPLEPTFPCANIYKAMATEHRHKRTSWWRTEMALLIVFMHCICPHLGIGSRWYICVEYISLISRICESTFWYASYVRHALYTSEINQPSIWMQLPFAFEYAAHVHWSHRRQLPLESLQFSFHNVVIYCEKGQKPQYALLFLLVLRRFSCQGQLFMNDNGSHAIYDKTWPSTWAVRQPCEYNK